MNLKAGRGARFKGPLPPSAEICGTRRVVALRRGICGQTLTVSPCPNLCKSVKSVDSPLSGLAGNLRRVPGMVFLLAGFRVALRWAPSL